jgi:hypothetical protein
LVERLAVFGVGAIFQSDSGQSRGHVSTDLLTAAQADYHERDTGYERYWFGRLVEVEADAAMCLLLWNLSNRVSIVATPKTCPARVQPIPQSMLRRSSIFRGVQYERVSRCRWCPLYGS